MGDIFSRSMKYVQHLGGKMFSDVAAYYFLTSKICFDVIGKKLESIISKPNLDDLSYIEVLVLPDLYFMDKEDAEKIISFVENGGIAYASGHTRHQLLGKVFGIEIIGEPKGITHT